MLYSDVVRSSVNPAVAVDDDEARRFDNIDAPGHLLCNNMGLRSPTKLVFRPPEIVCRRTYILPVFLSSFFLSSFFSPPNLRGR